MKQAKVDEEMERSGEDKNVKEYNLRVIGELWCHQCKMKKPKILCCDRFFKTDKEERCNGKYCESCVRRHYSTTVDQLGMQEKWICFKCQGKCACANCRRERGEKIPVKKRRRKIEGIISENSFHQSLPPITFPFSHILPPSPPCLVFQQTQQQQQQFSWEMNGERNGSHNHWLQNNASLLLHPNDTPTFLSQHVKVLSEAVSSVALSTEEENPESLERGSKSLSSSHPSCHKCREVIEELKQQISQLYKQIGELQGNIAHNTLPPLNFHPFSPLISPPLYSPFTRTSLLPSPLLSPFQQIQRAGEERSQINRTDQERSHVTKKK